VIKNKHVLTHLTTVFTLCSVSLFQPILGSNKSNYLSTELHVINVARVDIHNDTLQTAILGSASCAKF